MTTDKNFWEYTPEHADPDDQPLTEKDFMELAKGNRQYAIRLRHAVTWQHPATVIDEDLREGEIIEKNGTYIIIHP